MRCLRDDSGVLHCCRLILLYRCWPDCNVRKRVLVPLATTKTGCGGRGQETEDATFASHPKFNIGAEMTGYGPRDEFKITQLQWDKARALECLGPIIDRSWA
jgi:hypothetical protein